jgi:GNAT superfamily N-acetyltransferase
MTEIEVRELEAGDVAPRSYDLGARVDATQLALLAAATLFATPVGARSAEALPNARDFARAVHAWDANITDALARAAGDRNTPGVRIFVALEKLEGARTLVGVLCSEARGGAKPERIVDVHQLHVAPLYHGRGVGARLLAALIAVLPVSARATMTLQAHAGTPALGFYEHMQFVEKAATASGLVRLERTLDTRAPNAPDTRPPHQRALEDARIALEATARAQSEQRRADLAERERQDAVLAAARASPKKRARAEPVAPLEPAALAPFWAAPAAADARVRAPPPPPSALDGADEWRARNAAPVFAPGTQSQGDSFWNSSQPFGASPVEAS